MVSNCKYPPVASESEPSQVSGAGGWDCWVAQSSSLPGLPLEKVFGGFFLTFVEFSMPVTCCSLFLGEENTEQTCSWCTWKTQEDVEWKSRHLCLSGNFVPEKCFVRSQNSKCWRQNKQNLKDSRLSSEQLGVGAVPRWTLLRTRISFVFIYAGLL